MAYEDLIAKVQALLDRTSALLGRRTLTLNEEAEWWAGPADGGPNGDGMYPRTDGDGTVRLLPSPAKITALLLTPGEGSGSDAFNPAGTGLTATTKAGAIREIWARLSAYLNPLTVTTGRFIAGTEAGEQVDTISGSLAGSLLTVEPDDPRIIISGTRVLRGLAPVTPGQDIVFGLKETNQRARNNDRISQLLIKVIPDPPFTSAIAFGDSITAGQNATSVANRWFNLLCSAVGVTKLQNAGIPGTVLQNSNDATGKPRTDNGRDRYASTLVSIEQYDRIYLFYGFNDARYIAKPETFNVAQFKADYREVISELLFNYENDYQNLVLGSPCYITDAGLQTGSTGFAGQTRAKFEEFVTAALEVADEFGLPRADVYSYMRDHGAGTLISGDNIHPNDAGHRAIKAAFETAVVVRTAPTPTDIIISTDGSGNLTAKWSAPNGPVPAYYEAIFWPGIISSGSGNPQPISEPRRVDGFSTSWVARDGGNMRAAARAVYADGRVSAWRACNNSVYIAPPALLFLQDSFTDAEDTQLAAHVGEIGAEWSLAPGFNPAAGNVIYAGRVSSPSALGVYHASGQPNKASYDVTGVFKCVTASSSDTAGLLARSNPKVTTFFFADYRRGTGWRLFKTIGTTSTSLGTMPATFNTGETKTLVLSVRQNEELVTINGQPTRCTVWLTVDGVVVLGALDYTITAPGLAGMRFATARPETEGIQLESISARTIQG